MERPGMGRQPCGATLEKTRSSSPVTFDKEGEFKYHCKIHGKTMSGTIVVKLAAAN
jgi:plastocyanin